MNLTPPMCTICGAAMENLGPSELDQSGDTHLPAIAWSCPKCPGTVLVVATGEAWKANEHREGA